MHRFNNLAREEAWETFSGSQFNWISSRATNCYWPSKPKPLETIAPESTHLAWDSGDPFMSNTWVINIDNQVQLLGY